MSFRYAEATSFSARTEIRSGVIPDKSFVEVPADAVSTSEEMKERGGGDAAIQDRGEIDLAVDGRGASSVLVGASTFPLLAQRYAERHRP